MSQWNRTTLPTEADADEWGNILVLRENGMKAVYHWQNYNDHYAIDGETAWMTLPQSDIPQTISITIERGNRTWTIENNGFNVEIHDSRDPMGQPEVTTWLPNSDMPEVLADAVRLILESEDEDEDWCECEGEGVAVNDTVLQGFLDALRGNETASVPASKQKPWQKSRGK